MALPAERRGPDPARFDPWSGRRYGGVQWFAASTLVHAGLLFAFATVSLTVIRTVEEIKVKVIDDVGEGDDEGAPSLQDLAGLLNVQPAPQRQARPSGPVVRNVVAPALPKIGSLGPKIGTGPMVDLTSAALAFGSGGVGGLGGSFGDYVGRLRKVGLDLVLVIDTTESMQFVIDEVKSHCTNLVATIQRMVPTSRVGIVVYRDQGDEYVVKWTDLSFKTEKLRQFLSNISAGGGGDWEEAVKEGLDAAINELSWRKHSKKIIILVGGSPPHQEDLDAVQELVQGFRSAGGHLSTIDVTRRLHETFSRFMWRSLHGDEPYRPSEVPAFYQEVSEAYRILAKTGGGELVQLTDDKKLIRDVLVLTFGSRWRIEMAKYLKEIS